MPGQGRRYLVVGRSGVGKSSLINSSFGRALAEVGDFEPCTAEVARYGSASAQGNFAMIDTPGLAEGGTVEDLLAISKITSVTDLDQLTVVYVSPLDENRLRPDELRTIGHFTRAYGPRFWRNAWLVLTFAARVPESLRMRHATRRQSDIQGAIRSGFAFDRTWMVDNLTPGWCEGAVTLDQVLRKGG